MIEFVLTTKCDVCNTNIDTVTYHSRNISLGAYVRDLVRIQPTELSVVFTTEQTEGAASPPYLSKERLHLCKDCLQKIYKGSQLRGTGAQGINKYRF